MLCFVGITSAGHKLETDAFFDTLTITPTEGIDAIRKKAEQYEINLRYRDKEHVTNHLIPVYVKHRALRFFYPTLPNSVIQKKSAHALYTLNKTDTYT